MAGRCLWRLGVRSCKELASRLAPASSSSSGRCRLHASAVPAVQLEPHNIDTLLPGLWTQCCAATVDNFQRRAATEACTSAPDATPEEKRFFPRRALMYVPACEERKTKKASSLNVDTIVFDIEDGVALNQKASYF